MDTCQPLAVFRKHVETLLNLTWGWELKFYVGAINKNLLLLNCLWICNTENVLEKAVCALTIPTSIWTEPFNVMSQHTRVLSNLALKICTTSTTTKTWVTRGNSWSVSLGMHVNTRYNSTRGTSSWCTSMRMYLWWSLCALYLHACQLNITIGDSCFHCICVTSSVC